MADAHPLRLEVRLFLRALMLHCRDGIIYDIKADLAEGPPGKEPPPEKVALHEWFLQLDQGNQGHIDYLVSEIVDSTLFSMLALLDGVAGGYPVENRASDFALYLQIYADIQSQQRNEPVSSTRINKPDALEHLHDIFMAAVKDRKLLD